MDQFMLIETYDTNAGGPSNERAQFQYGDHVLVRCHQKEWFSGQVRRHSKNGIRVWIKVSGIMMHIPSELLSTHLVRLQDATASLSSTGGGRNLLLRLQFVRPSHLAHRNLYERVEVLPHQKYLKGAEEVSSNAGVEKSRGENKMLKKHPLLPRRPTSIYTGLARQDFDPMIRLSSECNPMCYGQFEVAMRSLEKEKINENRESLSPYDSDDDYITAYDIVDDPDDEDKMNQARADLYREYCARRAISVQSTTDNISENPNLPPNDTKYTSLQGTKEETDISNLKCRSSLLTKTESLQQFAPTSQGLGQSSKPPYKHASKSSSHQISGGKHCAENPLRSVFKRQSGLHSMVEPGGRDLPLGSSHAHGSCSLPVKPTKSEGAEQ